MESLWWSKFVRRKALDWVYDAPGGVSVSNSIREDIGGGLGGGGHVTGNVKAKLM